MSDAFQRALAFRADRLAELRRGGLRENAHRGRFIRTLKENLLWVVPFATVAELSRTLREFAGGTKSTG